MGTPSLVGRDLYRADLMHCHARNHYPQPIALTKVTVGIALSDTLSNTAGRTILASCGKSITETFISRFDNCSED